MKRELIGYDSILKKGSKEYLTIFFSFVETLFNAVSIARDEDPIQWKLSILSEDDAPQQKNGFVSYSKLIMLILFT
jgi:hypothetical protein